MGLRRLAYYLFMKARGDPGADLSRGPLSDLIREAAVNRLSGGSHGWILEVGVGEGLLARQAVDRGIPERYVGMDLQRDTVKTALGRFGVSEAFRGVCGRGDALPFKARTFSRVVCINTLHNQSSWEGVEKIVAGACGLVREGGSLIIDIRNGCDPLISSAYRYSMWFDPTTKRLPVRAYRLGRITELLRGHGFRITGKSGIYYPYWFLPSAYVIEARR